MDLDKVFFVIILLNYLFINSDAFFLLKALKKELFCKKTCYLYCRPKRDKIIDIHHYHSIDVHPEFYHHHHHHNKHFHHDHEHHDYYDIETTTKAMKPKPESTPHFLHHHYGYETPYEEYYYGKEESITEKPKPTEQDISYFSKDHAEYEDIIGKIVTTTKEAMPYIFGKDYEYKVPYYTDMLLQAKRKTTTKAPETNEYYSHYRNIKDMLSDYVDEENEKPRYKRSIKHFGYYVDVRHTHEIIKNKEEIEAKKEEIKEEPSGICLFCMKKCHYPRPPD